MTDHKRKLSTNKRITKDEITKAILCQNNCQIMLLITLNLQS